MAAEAEPSSPAGSDMPPAQQPPAAPAAAPAQPPVVGRVHRVGGISIKPAAPVRPADLAQLNAAEGNPDQPPLDLDMLTPWWSTALQRLESEQPKLAATLANRKLKVDGDDHFVIVVNNSYVEAEIRTHLVKLLEMLRELSGRRMLNCGIEIEYEEKKAVIYSPRDKYDAMSAKNPSLGTFKVLFPEVDY